MPFPPLLTRPFRREMRNRCQISGEYVGRAGEVHSSTRMHLIKCTLIKRTGEYLMQRPVDAVLLSNEVHQKVHNTANSHEKDPNAQYARPETVHKITWEALNWAMMDFAGKLIEKGIPYKKARQIVESKYTIPYSINDNKRDVMASYREGNDYYLEPVSDSYKYLTEPQLAEAGD